ncbi:hypothetical protein BV25DRAFT_1992812 [Artomyces pyxidatus]|uniref:Uncharacterized protein n=1 Tax=Artomyces pyxidatus TaxID=48021 RepID=A0ACB8SX95_9AGAM|nr:hypothetical protein BV25DRAFT_1992812 [Artomyces pyxidatus]
MSQVAVEVLRAVASAADVFPPLKSVAGGALHLTETVQKFKSNQKEWTQLAEDIQSHLACIVKLLPHDILETRDDLRAHITHLETTLNGIVSSIQDIQDQTGLKRVGTFVQDPERIKDMRKRFDNAIGLFQLTSSLTTGFDVAHIRGQEPIQLVVERALDKFRAEVASDIAAASAKENNAHSVVRDAFPLFNGVRRDYRGPSTPSVGSEAPRNRWADHCPIRGAHHSMSPGAWHAQGPRFAIPWFLRRAQPR